MSGEWTWINPTALKLLHEVSLAEHGGVAGIRDQEMFESAMDSPRNLAIIGKSDVADLAASYAHAFARTHAFVDGNKRTGFLAAGLFLNLNGQSLAATQAEATLAMRALAAGEISETEYAGWLRQHLRPRAARG
jgi:death on curing protein